MTVLDNYHFTQTAIKQQIGDRFVRYIYINKVFLSGISIYFSLWKYFKSIKASSTYKYIYTGIKYVYICK